MKKVSHGTLRYDLVFGVLALCIVGLGVRLAMLLKEGQDKAARMAARQHQLVVKLPARPGNIFARARNRYVLLAGSKQSPFCYIDPGMLTDKEIDSVAARVAGALGMNESEVRGLIYARRETNFVEIKADLDEDQVRAIRALRLRPVQIDYHWRRDYPNRELAATVVGFRQRIGGQPGGGLELTQNSFLAAEDGRKVFLADARRQPIWPVPEDSQLPRDGSHVFLSIDAAIQGFLQDAMQESLDKFKGPNSWATGIVLNPQTGQILAMCSLPTYDPSRYDEYPAEVVTNKAVCVPYEPGSAFKPIIASGAVDAGVVTFDTQIFCENGVYNVPRGGTISDHGASYGTLSVNDVIAYSSNIGMAKIGLKLGNARLYQIAQSFGFGKETGIELPGESGGILRTLSKWDGYSTARVPFGQEISVTTIQLAMAFSTIANGGLLLKPRVVDFVNDTSGKMIWHSKRQIVRRVLKQEVAEETVSAMQKVIEYGTGKACQMEKWSSFGKTGTAQITGGKKGYIDGAFTGSFIGAAPVGRAEILCLISIYWPDRSKGHFGATVAAPYVKQVLQRTLSYLNVPPDLQSESETVAKRSGKVDNDFAVAVDEQSDIHD